MNSAAMKVPPIVGTKRRENIEPNNAAANTGRSNKPVPGVDADNLDTIRTDARPAQKPENI